MGLNQYCSTETTLSTIGLNEEEIKTLIHEYIHYLQSPIWFTRTLHTWYVECLDI